MFASEIIKLVSCLSDNNESTLPISRCSSPITPTTTRWWSPRCSEPQLQAKYGSGPLHLGFFRVWWLKCQTEDTNLAWLECLCNGQ